AHVTRVPHLQWLGLVNCPGITDAGLSHLVHLKGPVGLDLRGSPNITNDGIQQLAAKKDWASIDLGGCPKITPEGVTKLQASLPTVKVTKDEKEWAFEGPEASSPHWRRR